MDNICPCEETQYPEDGISQELQQDNVIGLLRTILLKLHHVQEEVNDLKKVVSTTGTNDGLESNSCVPESSTYTTYSDESGVVISIEYPLCLIEEINSANEVDTVVGLVLSHLHSPEIMYCLKNFPLGSKLACYATCAQRFHIGKGELVNTREVNLAMARFLRQYEKNIIEDSRDNVTGDSSVIEFHGNVTCELDDSTDSSSSANATVGSPQSQNVTLDITTDSQLPSFTEFGAGAMVTSTQLLYPISFNLEMLDSLEPIESITTCEKNPKKRRLD